MKIGFRAGAGVSPVGKFAALGSALMLTLTGCPGPTPPTPQPFTICNLSTQDWRTIEDPAHSEARIWDELALNAVRNVLPQPTQHARTLYHLSAAMYDAWAVGDSAAQGVYFTEKHVLSPAQLNETLAFAARRVLSARYKGLVPGLADCFAIRLRHAGYDPASTAALGDSPAALGNRIGQAVLDAGNADGANEANKYADTSGYQRQNEPLVLIEGYKPPASPDHWQPLQLSTPFTQNGIAQAPNTPQPFVGANWGNVRPFAMTRQGRFYHDPGPAPSLSSPLMRSRWIPDLLRHQADLDTTSAATIDLSPGKLGNNPLGTNDGSGHPINPKTGQPYAANVVRLADFGRVIAEYWADGPRSETPPGHWNVLANGVTDDPSFERRLGGSGPELSALEWDVKLYLTLNGALHDAAITAWEIKRQTDTARPISLVRYLAAQDMAGLSLEPGLVEVQGGTLRVKSWRSGSGVQWQDASQWTPYQRSDFVSPAFPAFVSGHSTFSRAAAEVLSDLSGSAFFPGGLREVVAAPGFVKTDAASNVGAVRLQWATYNDAADQAGQSRIWGGIHLESDDLVGRRLGQQVGLDAVKKARQYFAGTAR
ncbi:vanadium-dependent haloperoxidase [Deinococcus sp.]|uniref:vanadium-dependent haloperoxidase n=1 Tax=Deinococcus sp. TaxID=47478 RepID=UPI0025E1341B|nr:vanadium-dependent haloperoxidase [Deinococcus sp.]